MKVNVKDVKAFITKDGSIIRELIHPKFANSKQSLALAEVPINGKTLLHRHKTSEEIYFILEGKGKMILDNKEFEIEMGDTILIPPNTKHKVINTGDKPLKILCASYPAYSDNDTELLE
ncbi:hypothetical protein J422_00526 [Methanocaldococcus villosus KIN24-T80]|uniref:Cupin type-2 domain-containing protein n=1 Tax=Methanocaldococcus villosus KIN24-T80 TaxID=1069083 RepID=N6VU84_9EURY|nr:cupin domain-containing protein [Methanocaldococcus villosus]ENN96756.1 hypothetical protein J422_00526 [Methanocaldococcus villosus KIN24-T80]